MSAVGWGDLLLAAESEYGRPSSQLDRYFRRLLRPNELKGLNVLEIGSGSGLASCLMAEAGSSVVALDPLEDGSNPRMLENQSHYLGVSSQGSSVTTIRQSFQAYRSTDLFDLILSHNSINHLDEEACRNATTKGADSYRTIFRQMKSLLKPNGQLWIADCARRNVWGAVKMKNPFAPSIEWDLHQEPVTWTMIASEVGFGGGALEWNVPTRLPLPDLPHSLSRTLAYLTTSHFTLRLRVTG